MLDVAVSWSGGKDSCLALHMAVEHGLNPVVLLCMVDQRGYSRSNGVNSQLLKLQAQALQLPIVFQETTWVNYEQDMICALTSLKRDYGIAQCVFGDIDIVAHREFEQNICHAAGIDAYLPLWGISRELVRDNILARDIKSKLVVVNKDFPLTECLAKDYASLDFEQLRKIGVDVCGENGEFHTLVYDAPLFNSPLKIIPGEIYDLGSVLLCDFQLAKE